MLVTGDSGGAIQLWPYSFGSSRKLNPHSRYHKRVEKAHKSKITCIAFTHESELIISGGWDCSVKVWDITATTTTVISELELQSSITHVLSLTGSRIASTCNANYKIIVSKDDSGDRVHTLEGHSGWITCMSALPHENVKLTLLASGSRDKSIRVWDVTAGSTVMVLDEHKYPITCMAVLSDGRLISGSGLDAAWLDPAGELKVWQKPALTSDSTTAEPAADGDGQDAA